MPDVRARRAGALARDAVPVLTRRRGRWSMLTIATWLWAQPGRVRAYTSEHVDRLAAMVRKHYARPHRFAVVTNDPGPFADGVEVVPDAGDFAGVHSPEGGTWPSCYRRLRLFHPLAGEIFGPRVVSLDLDVVLTGDPSTLWHRPEPITLYADPIFEGQANGSMVVIDTGAAPFVWSDFDPATSPTLTRDWNLRGSDQAWISYCLPDAPRVGPEGGIYSFRRQVGPGGELPTDSRLVVFHGRAKPWGREAQSLAWVREHYGEI